MKIDRRDINGSMIAFFSGLVKQYGGYNFAQGIPGFDPPQELIESLHKAADDSVHQYPPGNGLPELQNQIIRKYADQVALQPEQVTVLQGATEAISLVYLYVRQLFGGHLKSLAFDPAYESYSNLPAIYGDEMIRYAPDQAGQIDWDDLDGLIKAHKPGLVFINSPGNPFGKIWSEKEIRWIIDLAEKYDFYIIFDGVYLDLYYAGEAPFNPLAMSNKRVFYVNSFSKLFSITGWRIGYLIANRDHMTSLRGIHDYTGLCTSSVLQYALADYLSNETLTGRYVTETRQKLMTAAKEFTTFLQAHDFRFEIPQAGYFIWAELPEEQLDGVGFCLSLFNQHKVAMVPGEHFTPSARRFIRINYAREKQELRAGIQAFESFLSS